MVRIPVFERMIRAVIEPQQLTWNEYGRWVADHDTVTPAARKAIRDHMATLSGRPLISVVMPTYNSDLAFLRQAIASVRAQLYPEWELCIADDGSSEPGVWAMLQKAAAEDPRIKIVRRPENGHISAASNSALALAGGAFVALMDHDDVLPENALYEIACEILEHPDADLIYSDEDKIDGDGRRFEPYFKPDWSPELLLSQNLVNHLAVFRRSLVEELGGFREGFEGSQDYDLVLRVADATSPERIRHVPRVLYHWRQFAGPASFSERARERCADAAVQAVSEHLARAGKTGATVGSDPALPAWVQVRWPVPDPAPLVSIIVPTRDRVELLGPCLDGVLNRTDYPAIEVLVVDNGSVEPATFELFDKLRQDPRVRIVPAPGPFNYSALNNQAAAEAKGDILLLLNNDIDVIGPDWLSAMVGQAVRPEVGAVGARLLYGDGRVQHGGVILGIGGDPPVAGHAFHHAPREETGYFGHLRIARNVSAVTAACLALRREVFVEVGGLDADNLAVAFNDVDLCLKIRERGYQIVWTPRAELYHLESASRGSDTRPETAARFAREIAHMRARWGPVLDADPYFNPNFDRRSGDNRLTQPPPARWLRARAAP